MRALWSDRQNCSHNVSQKIKRIRHFSADFPEISRDLVEFGRHRGNSGNLGKFKGNSMEFSGVLYGA